MSADSIVLALLAVAPSDFGTFGTPCGKLRVSDNSEAVLSPIAND
jgi:hypothetical protein